MRCRCFYSCVLVFVPTIKKKKKKKMIMFKFYGNLSLTSINFRMGAEKKNKISMHGHILEDNFFITFRNTTRL